MNAKPERRDITVMVRYTASEYAKVVADAKGEQPAVYVRRRSLADDAPDCDPKIAEVTVRSPGGHVDGVVGVYTLSRAAGMIALRRAAGWTASYRIVDEQPKVGGELPDPAAQIATLTIEDITAARLRDEGRRAPKT